MRQVKIRRTAQAEIDDQAAWLAEYASENTAYRFLAAVIETISVLAETPTIGPLWPTDHSRLQDIRRYRIAGFPNHLMFYRHDDRTLEILHLYHGYQDLETRLAEDPQG